MNFKILGILIIAFLFTTKLQAQDINEQKQIVLEINELLKSYGEDINGNVTTKIRVENDVLFYDTTKPGVYTTTYRVGLNRINPKKIKLKQSRIEFSTHKGKRFISKNSLPDARFNNFRIPLKSVKNKEQNKKLEALFIKLVAPYNN